LGEEGRLGLFGPSEKLGMANLDLLFTIWNNISGLLYLFYFFNFVCLIKFCDFAYYNFFLYNTDEMIEYPYDYFANLSISLSFL